MWINLLWVLCLLSLAKTFGGGRYTRPVAAANESVLRRNSAKFGEKPARRAAIRSCCLCDPAQCARDDDFLASFLRRRLHRRRSNLPRPSSTEQAGHLTAPPRLSRRAPGNTTRTGGSNPPVGGPNQRAAQTWLTRNATSSEHPFGKAFVPTRGQLCS